MNLTRICIRCGHRYIVRKRTPEDAGKSFPQYYCDRCIKQLPVHPIIAEVK